MSSRCGTGCCHLEMADGREPSFVVILRRARRGGQSTPSLLVAVCDVGCPLLTVLVITAAAYGVGRIVF